MSGSGPAGTSSVGSHLSFNPDLPLVDQVVALATLTAAGDQPCATSLLAALPNQAEVTRIGAEALVVWAHRLYSGPGYWNPLRPDLLAEQHLADTAQLARPRHRRRPARRRAALGSRTIHPAARRTDPRRPEPACHPGGSQRAARRGAPPDRRPGGHRRARRSWPTWPASRCSWHPSPAWPPRS